ncbi:MAG: hypothetical protein ACJ790_20305 [Myxococcaceae bacterium]
MLDRGGSAGFTAPNICVGLGVGVPGAGGGAVFPKTIVPVDIFGGGAPTFAVKTWLQRVHCTGAPCGGMTLSSRT